jgi:hypothetical protein
MTTFLQAIESQLNTSQTENGAKAYKSTLNRCLDLFGQVGACRNDPEKARKLFAYALNEDAETAVRAMFWVRDVRGGQGERKVFRELLKYLAQERPDLVARLLPLVAEYGRWDDLFEPLEGSKIWPDVLVMVQNQFNRDILSLTVSEDSQVSLLGKWLPSINASSPTSKRLGREIASKMGLTEKQYRKALKNLRERIRIVEQAMCSREWSNIDYSKLPSRAAFMYRKAFAKQDGERYSAYLTAVEKGEAKINASTLYPSDIVYQYLYKGAQNDKTIDLQWEALPNYMEGLDFNGLVVADVSGSMSMYGGQPMAASIGLAMYIAERNTSEAWKGKFLTFSERPALETIVGKTIGQRIRNLERAAWSMNTDLMAVFKTVLDAAEGRNLPQEEMPQKLIIVSDMQFDQCCKSNKRTNFEQIQKLYRKAGYEMPQLVFWNVRSSDNVPVKQDDSGTCLVSGYSPSVLKTILTGKIVSPVETMRDVLYSERYAPVALAFEN